MICAAAWLGSLKPASRAADRLEPDRNRQTTPARGGACRRHLLLLRPLVSRGGRRPIGRARPDRVRHLLSFNLRAGQRLWRAVPSGEKPGCGPAVARQFRGAATGARRGTEVAHPRQVSISDRIVILAYQAARVRRARLALLEATGQYRVVQWVGSPPRKGLASRRVARPWEASSNDRF